MAEASSTKKQKRAWRKQKDDATIEKEAAHKIEEIVKMPPAGGVEVVEIDGSLLEGVCRSGSSAVMNISCRVLGRTGVA